jgi:RHS repeat-associated protein
MGLLAQSTMTAGYAYDSDGLRRSNSVDRQTTGFTWDTSGGLPLLLSTHKAGLDTAIIYGPGNQAVAQIADDGTPSWFHHDQLGTIRLTTNATGAETYRGSHSAYGAPVASTGTAPLLGYAGQYRDVETGYQYLRARYYDPATAQFLTVDPLAATTLEPYGYTGANPLNATDPTGLAPSGSGPKCPNGGRWDRSNGCQGIQSPDPGPRLQPGAVRLPPSCDRTSPSNAGNGHLDERGNLRPRSESTISGTAPPVHLTAEDLANVASVAHSIGACVLGGITGFGAGAAFGLLTGPLAEFFSPAFGVVGAVTGCVTAAATPGPYSP